MSKAILADNIGKKFSRYRSDRPMTLMEAALSSLRRIQPLEKFWALRGVSFEVAEGEMIGVIGHNGAGKSTLLQILGKVAYPTEGRVTMRGRVGALLDLGAGFHGDLTGEENVFVTAIVAGLSRREVIRNFDDIVTFAELEGSIDSPLRTYSTGMMMRLAFSIAVHTYPDILLVDEFLSVGDLAFQAKCHARISEMRKQGCAIVLVSHDAAQVERLCDRVLWLKHGVVNAYGEPTVVAGQYKMEMRLQTARRTPLRPATLTSANTKLIVNENRFGSLEAEIVDVRFDPIPFIDSGNSLTVEIDYQTKQLIDRAIFSISITDEDGDACLDVNTSELNIPCVRIRERGTLKLILERLDLQGGRYFVNIGIFHHGWQYAYDYHWNVYPLVVNSTLHSYGILSPPRRWEVDSVDYSRR